MSDNYFCPVCKGQINVNDNIVLIAFAKNNMKGLVFLHTELGNYKSNINSSFKIEENEQVEFLCPYCHSNIEYHTTKTNLANLVRINDNNKESLVIFSKIYGEKCTYVIEDKKLKTYGEHAKRYSDPEWFIK